HANAGGCIEHPRGEHRHEAGQNLDMDVLSRLPVIAPLDTDATAKQSMPRVVDDSELPDMGRMNG
ncbi:hypothetical protein, partial [Sphingomonas sp.]|uniref:hypothetical protein n=1 Tax=Sphingomonas sp. TaxID=28214 RepID=UPI002DD64B00